MNNVIYISVDPPLKVVHLSAGISKAGSSQEAPAFEMGIRI